MTAIVQRVKRVLRPYRRGFAAWRAARAHNASMTGEPLWFHPELPAPKSGIFAIAAALGRPIRRGTSAEHPTFAWADKTVTAAPPAALRDVGAINRDCVDISKTTVDRVHGEVFGRSLTVDPTAHAGPMVEKSDDNATHDGRIVDGPLPAPSPGRVYQRVIDATDDGEAVDLRVAVVGDRLPVLNEKRRPLAVRFTNDNTAVIPRDVDEVLSTDEQADLLALARGIGMDFGEFDVLRDRTDGLIWVVDANKTPYLPAALSEQDRARTVSALADALEATLFS